jgi:mRNA interferase MazF
MKRGTIVLTKFPFSNLKSAKRRPAVVVSKTENEKNDVIVAFISSVIPVSFSATDYLFNSTNRDFKNSGLKKESIIKLDKLSTLNKEIFTGELGTLSADTLKELNKRLRIALDLNE